MKNNKLQKKPVKIDWQNLPRKCKKFAKKLLNKVINTKYECNCKRFENDKIVICQKCLVDLTEID